MDAFELVLLFDTYGGMLTDKQRDCFDMRHNQDLSLGEIADIMGVSRQAVNDNLTRTEALLRRMEENIGCIRRDRKLRKALDSIRNAAGELAGSSDPSTVHLGHMIVDAVRSIEE
jgi:predicted DNA-binding protein YlxM (UPF0122 family)